VFRCGKREPRLIIVFWRRLSLIKLSGNTEVASLQKNAYSSIKKYGKILPHLLRLTAFALSKDTLCFFFDEKE